MKIMNLSGEDIRLTGVDARSAWAVTIPAGEVAEVDDRAMKSFDFCRHLSAGHLLIEDSDEESGTSMSTKKPIPYRQRQHPTRQDMLLEIDRLGLCVKYWRDLARSGAVFMVLMMATYIAVIFLRGVCG